MTRVIAKGNYLKGKLGMSKAHAHLKYIEDRPGKDKDENPRQFFGASRDNVSSAEIRDRIDHQDRRVVMHRIVLSPGYNQTDLEEFTRETLRELSDRKGQELEWYAIHHRNTHHSHIHVCVMGKDRHGELVRLNSNDYRAIRAHGDYYMERNHGIERYLESEARRLLDDKDYKRLDRKWLNPELKRYEHGGGDDRKRSERALHDRMEWEQLDRELRKSFSEDRGEIFRRKTGKQFQIEMAGRHLETHERIQIQLARQRWEFIAAKYPDQAPQIAGELMELDKAMDAFRAEIHQKTSFEKLMRDFDYTQKAERIDYQYLFRELPTYDRREGDIEQHSLQAKVRQEPELEDLFQAQFVGSTQENRVADLEPDLKELFESMESPDPVVHSNIDVDYDLFEMQEVSGVNHETDESSTEARTDGGERDTTEQEDSIHS